MVGVLAGGGGGRCLSADWGRGLGCQFRAGQTGLQGGESTVRGAAKKGDLTNPPYRLRSRAAPSNPAPAKSATCLPQLPGQLPTPPWRACRAQAPQKNVAHRSAQPWGLSNWSWWPFSSPPCKRQPPHTLWHEQATGNREAPACGALLHCHQASRLRQAWIDLLQATGKKTRWL